MKIDKQIKTRRHCRIVREKDYLKSTKDSQTGIFTCVAERAREGGREREREGKR